MKEASDIIGVPQSTLRYWEKEFKEISPRRSAGNQRYYSPADLETLEIIHYLLHIKGLKIDAAKEQLKRNRKNISKKLDILQNLKNLKEELEILLQSLNLRNQN